MASTVLGAPLGVHALNFAAISAALSAGPEAGPDPARRWRAAAVSGGFNIGLGLVSAGLVAIVLAAPHGVVLAAAGLALVPTFALSLRSAFGADDRGVQRVEAPAVTFLVAASGLTVLGVGAAFWGLLAGIALSLVLPPSAVLPERPVIGPGFGPDHRHRGSTGPNLATWGRILS